MRLAEKLSLGYAYGTSLLSYMVDGPPRPFSATFAVTNRCNLRCSYCNCPFIDPTSLDLPRIELLFDRLREMGIRRLGLAGGEPMMRRDLGEIIALAKARGFWVSVNSNLTLFDRHPERLALADLVYTSLDGDEDAHVAARGDGSWDGVVTAIRALVGGGKPVIAICVVTEHSIGHADGLLRLAEALGFRMHFQPQCIDTDVVRGTVSDAVSNERFRAFWRSLLDEKRRGRPIVSSTPYLEFLSRWDDFSVSAFYAPGVRCAAGNGFLYIDPLGRAYPCVYVKGKTTPVDLLAHGWREAWNRKTPCTVCTVGPMLEFNLLFQRPLAAAVESVHAYA
ncbi:MAG TPA: radical SAM protein [Candidatus Binatia bacterium]|nr:radical SAM protein [Candidatus Binatia bacterium]